MLGLRLNLFPLLANLDIKGTAFVFHVLFLNDLVKLYILGKDEQLASVAKRKLTLEQGQILKLYAVRAKSINIPNIPIYIF